jgi:hypothetical protein
MVNFDAKVVTAKAKIPAGIVLGSAEAATRAADSLNAGTAGARFAGALGIPQFRLRGKYRRR